MEENTVSRKENNSPSPKATNYKKLILVLVIVLLLVGAGAWKLLENSPLNPFNTQQQQAPLANVGPNDPVVRVNGEEIIRSQVDAIQSQMLTQQGIDPATLDAATQQELLTQALNAAVAQTLLRQEVKKAGISVTQEDIDAEIAKIRAEFESEDAYQEALTTQNLTEDQLRVQLSTQLETQGYLNQKLDLESLTASQEEVNEAYAQLDEASEEELPPLEEARADLEQSIITQKKQQAVDRHIQELQSQADIEVLI